LRTTKKSNSEKQKRKPYIKVFLSRWYSSLTKNMTKTQKTSMTPVTQLTHQPRHQTQSIPVSCLQRSKIHASSTQTLSREARNNLSGARANRDISRRSHPARGCAKTCLTNINSNEIGEIFECVSSPPYSTLPGMGARFPVMQKTKPYPDGNISLLYDCLSGSDS